MQRHFMKAIREDSWCIFGLWYATVRNLWHPYYTARISKSISFRVFFISLPQQVICIFLAFSKCPILAKALKYQNWNTLYLKLHISLPSKCLTTDRWDMGTYSNPGASLPTLSGKNIIDILYPQEVHPI